MFDTIRLRKDNKGDRSVPQSLTNLKEHYTDKGEHYLTGNLSNIYITINRTTTTINGSLNKYHHKTNLHNMSRLDAKLAIENLEDELQMSLLDSRATRLDIASNIIVNERVKNYLDLLDYASHYTKLVQPNSIYFRNTLRELCLYDKIAEMKAKRQPIPQEYEGKNILRAELRYTSRLATQLKKEVTAQDLYQEDFYLGIFKEWQKQMLQIRTRKELAPTIKKMTTEQFKNYLLAIYIEEQGLDNVLKMVDNNKGNFTNDKAYKRTKESLKNTRHLTEDNNLMKEFEDKIRTMSN